MMVASASSARSAAGPSTDARHDRLGDAELHHAVGVRRRRAGQAPGLGECRRERVRVPVGAGVVDLDVVHHGSERIEGPLPLGRLGATGRSEPVEWMRQADQATLLVDGGRRLRRGQAGRHRTLQVQADHVAVGGADLLAHDDGQAVRAPGHVPEVRRRCARGR